MRNMWPGKKDGPNELTIAQEQNSNEQRKQHLNKTR
jgi:hypothetical protein